MAAKPITRSFKQHWALIIILLLAVFTRFWNLGFPRRYIFDEVYHAFTAVAYARNDPAGYEWWHQSPVKGTAYEWLHPPLAKLFMAGGILVFGDNSFGWRFFSAVFGVVAIFLLYLVGKKLFNPRVGLLAAFLATLDGLFLTQSRIAMNDIFLVVFVLAALYFLLRWEEVVSVVDPPAPATPLLLSFFFTGLATATKWPGVFLVPLIGFTVLYRFYQSKRDFRWLKRQVPVFIGGLLMVPAIYLVSYGQWWLQGHSIGQFIELHEQVWWYQTNLQATHTYGSKAWTWPLMIRPVWYFVDYATQGRIGNIYALGNPLIWWNGLAALAMVLYKAVTDKAMSYKLLAISYFLFWLPWLFSPRVMFLYHYLPSLTFLILGLAWFWTEMIRERWVKVLFIGSIVLVFLLFYPHWTGAAIPEAYHRLLLWLPSWK